MQIERFKQLVARLDQQSSVAPRVYRIKVAALAMLGFAILAMLLATAGLGLVLLVGLVVSMVLTGGGALLVLLKLGKLLLLLALPLWFLMKSAVRALFVRLPAPVGREITRSEAPALFDALDTMRERMKGPSFHHVHIVDGVNAAVVQRPALGLVGWPRNYLLLGLPLLEALPPAEALAVVGHEYGHLAGSHGRFSAFIYRLRHTWGVVQTQAEHFQGWLSRLVIPLVRWYAPYFNAYTFVLARADEYAADAASADLVGRANAAHALKRVNLVVPRHERFMHQVFDRIDHEPQPPRDLMQRWATDASEPPTDTQARRWLSDALDREGQPTDTHPTLRARLAALQVPGEVESEPPPVPDGVSAANAWLGPTLAKLRSEFGARWADQVAHPWAERYAQTQHKCRRLAELRALAARDEAQQIEMLRLILRLEPDVDLREPLAAFNAANANHPLGLFLEATVRLGHGEREGLILLDRSMVLDPEATKPGCECAHTFLMGVNDVQAAETYAERWRRRDEMETLRAQQLERIEVGDSLVDAVLSDEQLRAMRARLQDRDTRQHVARVYLARRLIPVDPDAVQILLGVKLDWWGRRRGKHKEVVQRLAGIEWPLPMVVLTLDGRHAKLLKSFERLPRARLM